MTHGRAAIENSFPYTPAWLGNQERVGLGAAVRKSFNKGGFGQHCQRLTGQAGYGLKCLLEFGNQALLVTLARASGSMVRGWRPTVEGGLQREDWSFCNGGSEGRVGRAAGERGLGGGRRREQMPEWERGEAASAGRSLGRVRVGCQGGILCSFWKEGDRRCKSR